MKAVVGDTNKDIDQYGDDEYINEDDDPDKSVDMSSVVVDDVIVPEKQEVVADESWSLLEQVPERVVDQRIDLKDELKDDGVNVRNPKAAQIIMQYPRLVDYRDYEKIRQEVLQAIFKN